MLRKIALRDGTETFLNEAIGCSYHSQAGIVAEALQRYVLPCQITELAQQDELHILDVGFGLGCNAAIAIDAAVKQNPNCRIFVVGLEIDEEILLKIPEMELPCSFYRQVKRLQPPLFAVHEGNVRMHILVGDARLRITELAADFFDAVFFDPFPPDKTPELWQTTFLQEIWRVLKETGTFATYVCDPKVREHLAAAGFLWDERLMPGRRGPGTTARKWV